MAARGDVTGNETTHNTMGNEDTPHESITNLAEAPAPPVSRSKKRQKPGSSAPVLEAARPLPPLSDLNASSAKRQRLDSGASCSQVTQPLPPPPNSLGHHLNKTVAGLQAIINEAQAERRKAPAPQLEALKTRLDSIEKSMEEQNCDVEDLLDDLRGELEEERNKRMGLDETMKGLIEGLMQSLTEARYAAVREKKAWKKEAKMLRQDLAKVQGQLNEMQGYVVDLVERLNSGGDQ